MPDSPASGQRCRCSACEVNAEVQGTPASGVSWFQGQAVSVILLQMAPKPYSNQVGVLESKAVVISCGNNVLIFNPVLVLEQRLEGQRRPNIPAAARGRAVLFSSHVTPDCVVRVNPANVQGSPLSRGPWPVSQVTVPRCVAPPSPPGAASVSASLRVGRWLGSVPHHGLAEALPLQRLSLRQPSGRQWPRLTRHPEGPDGRCSRAVWRTKSEARWFLRSLYVRDQCRNTP